jgi:hypothetical protein
LSELLAAVHAGELSENVTTSFASMHEHMIEAEVTATIGATAHQGTITRLAMRKASRSVLARPPQRRQGPN